MYFLNKRLNKTIETTELFSFLPLNQYLFAFCLLYGNGRIWPTYEAGECKLCLFTEAYISADACIPS